MRCERNSAVASRSGFCSLCMGTCALGPLDEVDPDEFLQVLRPPPVPEPGVEGPWVAKWGFGRRVLWFLL